MRRCLPLLFLLVCYLVAALLCKPFADGTVTPTPVSWVTNTPLDGSIETWTKTNTPNQPSEATATASLTSSLAPETPTSSPSLSSSTTPTLSAPNSPLPVNTESPKPPTTPTPTTTPLPTDDPTPTQEFSLPSLRACLLTPGATCPLAHNITLDSTLLISGTGVTLVCVNGASITNSPDNVNSILDIRAGTVEGCLIYRTMNTALSCCADTVSVNNARGVILRGNTILFGIDGTLDISTCDDCLIEQNIIAESLHCSTHRNGCHGFLSLVRDSRRVRFVHNLLASAKARMPQFQNCQDCAFLNNVVANYDGLATQVTLCSEVDYANNFGLRGRDTDDEAYLIRTPNLLDQPEGACKPKVFLANNIVNQYRITCPCDEKAGVFVFAPLTAYYPLEDIWTMHEIMQNAGAAGEQTTRVRGCVLAASCVIVDAPPD